MRIVQVLPFFHPHAGGVESHVRGLVREFTREGHEVTVVTSRYDRHLPVQEEMEGAAELLVPLKVDLNAANNWMDTK